MYDPDDELEYWDYMTDDEFFESLERIIDAFDALVDEDGEHDEEESGNS